MYLLNVVVAHDAITDTYIDVYDWFSIQQVRDYVLDNCYNCGEITETDDDTSEDIDEDSSSGSDDAPFIDAD